MGHLEHGVNHADACLWSIGHKTETARPFASRPYPKGGKVNDAAKWLQSTVARSRQDLVLPSLKWHVSQPPSWSGYNTCNRQSIRL